MEVGSSLLAQSLRERMTPVLLLLPSPAVEESCAKNNLSFLDILRPFSTVHEIDVPVRTASDQPFRLQEFRLRMFYAADICQPTVESAEECLLKVVNSSSEEALAELPGDPQNLEVIKKMIQSESLSSWFQRYSKTFIQALAFSEHETFDHPIACMRAVSSKDDNPIHKFVELYDTDPMPSLLSDGNMDPKLLKIYVLIHDYQDGPADRAYEILSEMRGTFGFNDCWLLCINSGGSSEPATVGEEFWKSDTLFTTNSKKDVNGSISDMKLGSCLSENDLNEISDLIAQVCCKSILPYMEQKIRSLNQQVVATKRGLKNQIKNLWWRKGKDDVSDSSNIAMYTFGSIEAQIRVLADYAFMLHDYELALSNYRLISSDYKMDKAWKHYAGAQEMIGLSLFLLDQSRKEAELCMESAFSTYQKLVASGQRLSTRCALWWAEMHKARGQYKEAANVFFRSGTEEPHLRAGIFLEQAAYCYLRATTPMLRKYGFYLVLAGNRYNVCGQKKHALRAYMSVLTIFEGQGWNYINDHVIFNLGRLSEYLGNFSGAVQHFQKLISCSHQSPSNQATFLKEFLQAVQNANFDPGKMLLLDLPAINKGNVRVHFEDQRTYASLAASMLPDDMWLPLEVGLTPLVRTSTWLDSASLRKSIAEASESNESVAGEALTVDVEFFNPLQVSLNLSSVSLLCRFDTEGLESKGAHETGADSHILHEPERDQSTSADARDNESQSLNGQQNISIAVAEDFFTIKAGEHYKAQLKVIPHEQGLLQIMGVKWTLSGIVRGYQMFNPGEARPNSRKGKRDKPHIPPPHQRLKFFVREHMPRLEVSLHGMPEKVNSGELHRVVLELSNTSGVAIKNLKFRTSQPGILIVGEIQDLDAEFPNCLEAPFVEKQKYGEKVFSGEIASDCIYTFPQTVILESGSTLLWPLWLHAREAGILLLNNVLYYEASDVKTGIRYRTARMSHTLEVFPSLQVSVHISPCLQLEQYLLRLDIANKHNTESFWLRQVSCIGSRWQIAPLLPPVAGCDASKEKTSTDFSQREAAFLSASVSPSQLLPAGQTLSLFFQLLDLVKGDSTFTHPEFISNVRLGPPSSTEPLIDVTRGPVFRFHTLVKNSNKKEQSSTSQVEPTKILDTTLDVILISEQQDEPTTEKPAAFRDGQRLATQHICYCSMSQSSPLVWLMEGPTSISHDFSRDPCCKISFYLTLKNYSQRTASVRVYMAPTDFPSDRNTMLTKSRQGNQGGWYDISLDTSADSKLKEEKDSGVHKSTFEAANLPATPFIWSSLNIFKIDRLGSGEMGTYPLQLSVFAPGIYDLSGYHLSWELLPEPSNFEISSKQKEVVSVATPTTFSSSFVASDANQNIAGNLGSHSSNDADAISGSGCGHTFILTVEGK